MAMKRKRVVGQTHTVSLTAPASGVRNEVNFVYAPKVLRASMGDSIRWEFEGGAFVVHFPGATPFNVVDVRSGDTVEVANHAAPGTYSYAVSIWDGRWVHVDTSSGTIIIERGRTR